MNIRLFTAILSSALCVSATTAAQNTNTSDKEAARKLSDSFMSDLLANRSSEAIQKLRVPREVGTGQYTQMVNDCGRPLESKTANDGKPIVGQDVGLDGKSKDILTFLYTYKSTRHSGWVFHVDVETTDNGNYRVSGFGCRNPNP